MRGQLFTRHPFLQGAPNRSAFMVGSTNPQLFIAKWLFRQFSVVAFPSNELSHALLGLLVIQYSTALIHFKPIQKNGNCLCKNAGLPEEQLVSAVAAVVRSQVSCNQCKGKPMDRIS